MRALLFGLLLTSVTVAEPVPSYSYQGPKRPVRQVHSLPARAPQAMTFQPQPGEWGYRPPQGQQAVPGYLANWGGTVVQADSSGMASITSNGNLPSGSLVGIGRGTHFLGQARVTAAGSGSAQLATLGPLQLQPGDWVNVVSIPAPPQQAVSYAGFQRRYHPTSTNADPTYQRWLRQGFTMGRVHRGRSYSSGFYFR